MLLCYSSTDIYEAISEPGMDYCTLYIYHGWLEVICPLS